ncbi:MAG: RodZ domain-containing protein [Candidatus Omnitrophota bacterium]
MSEIPRDPGIFLKQERMSKGISLDVVHEATKIPLDALKAIEEGYKVRALTGFYFKSFIKIYAQYLGLDAAVVMGLIPGHHVQPPIVTVPVQQAKVSASGAHRVEGVRQRTAVLRSPDMFRKKKKILSTVLMVVLFVMGVLVLGAVVRKVISAAAARHALNLVTRPKVPLKKTASVTHQSAVGTAAPKDEGAGPLSVEKVQEKSTRIVSRVTVTVRAQTTTWVTVKADGDTIFQDRIKKGTAESWSSAKKIEISAQDLGALEFEVNGRNIGKIARRDLKARKVIVTTDGFSVEK